MDRRTATAMLLASIANPIGTVSGAFSPERALPSPEPFIERPPTTPALGCRKSWMAWPGRGPLLATVQTFGGPLPVWAQPGSHGNVADYEIVLVRAEGPISCQATAETVCRFLLVDERLDPPPHADYGFIIRAAASDLDATAEVLAHSLVGDVLIGLDLCHLLDLASPQNLDAGFDCSDREHRINNQGHAAIVDGLGSGLSLVPAAREVWDGLGRKGFDRGVFVAALVSEEDTGPFTLAGFDAFLTALTAPRPHRPFAITAVLNASRSAVLMVGF